MFAQEFSGVILIANLVARLILQHWLSGDAYRINIGLSPFIVVSLSLLLCIIALGMTRKLAVTAPVKSLRTE